MLTTGLEAFITPVTKKPLLDDTGAGTRTGRFQTFLHLQSSHSAWLCPSADEVPVFCRPSTVSALQSRSRLQSSHQVIWLKLLHCRVVTHAYKGRLASYTQQLHSISVYHSTNPNPNPIPNYKLLIVATGCSRPFAAVSSLRNGRPLRFVTPLAAEIWH